MRSTFGSDGKSNEEEEDAHEPGNDSSESTGLPGLEMDGKNATDDGESDLDSDAPADGEAQRGARMEDGKATSISASSCSVSNGMGRKSE